ncbi:ethanolamine utilization protein EutM [Enterococcus sp. PF1-24]|uniref:BMC domain-containing protein n=1 Tax=unclassified Enterococcus TaxID=2608891 RepID=UPI00247B7160|nr:ethanolamine utilization protein EutM [Enterococcus sp. PFB1-1]MDH6401190.1 ethanolamine utilization protein EutM [Enterococcus sp. PF1-24]
MNAIGFIETKGLIPAIEACDVMLKTSQVELVERSFVGGGLVTITVTGDVGAVKAAVDAGASSVSKFGTAQLITQHVIPRPHTEVAEVLFDQPAEASATLAEEVIVVEETASETVTEEIVETIFNLENINQETLKTMTVKELRQLAKQFDNLGLTDQALAMANRSTLMKRFSVNFPE